MNLAGRCCRCRWRRHSGTYANKENKRKVLTKKLAVAFCCIRYPGIKAKHYGQRTELQSRDKRYSHSIAIGDRRSVSRKEQNELELDSTSGCSQEQTHAETNWPVCRRSHFDLQRGQRCLHSPSSGSLQWLIYLDFPFPIVRLSLQVRLPFIFLIPGPLVSRELEYPHVLPR
jgi:hypothetical protein